MRLVKQDIDNIDKWLIRIGIKYIDIRYELIDHLVTEYQQIENYPDLEGFLLERKSWCRKVAKEKEKAAHFGNMKALFRKFFRFFISFKSLAILIFSGLALIAYEGLVSAVLFKYSVFLIVAILSVYELYLTIYSGFGNDLKKKSLSVMFLLNIFMVPQLPVYFFGQIPNSWMENPYFSLPFSFSLILLHCSAILVFYEKRRTLLKELMLLKELI